MKKAFFSFFLLLAALAGFGQIKHIIPKGQPSAPGPSTGQTGRAQPPAIVDKDMDGIDDNEEHRLLEKFRPFFLFSNDGGDERFLPADAWWYITQSEMLLSGDENQTGCINNGVLAMNPNALLFEDSTPCARFHSSRINKNPIPTQYHLNPLNKVGSVGNDPGRHGNALNVVLASRRTGLYGHVVPIRLTDPFAYSFDKTYDGNSQGQLYYKIEYWQLFGYNSADKPFNIGDHEGDWTSVQLIYDPQYQIIRSVFHFAHGLLFRFDITSQNNARSAMITVPEGTIKEIRGINYNFQNQSLDLSHLDAGTIPERILVNDGQLKLAQNSMLRLFQDPTTKEFTHPVCYIENGTHEFYPTENWSYYGAPNHNGASYHYLTNTPPNLGEVEHHLDEDRAAMVIMEFNGFWGAYGSHNDPPTGPILHKSWQWPMGSSVRWLITASMGF